MKQVQNKICDMVIDKIDNGLYNELVNQTNIQVWNKISNRMWFPATDRVSNTVSEKVKL